MIVSKKAATKNRRNPHFGKFRLRKRQYREVPNPKNHVLEMPWKEKRFLEMWGCSAAHRLIHAKSLGTAMPVKRREYEKTPD